MFYGSPSELSRIEEDNLSVLSVKANWPGAGDCIVRPPSPTEVLDGSLVDQTTSSSADNFRTGILDVDLQDPVMTTPSKCKRVLTKRLHSSASTSLSSPSSQASLQSSKTAPSPAKRWKQAVVSGEAMAVIPDPVAEMEEILNPPKVC